MPDIDETIDDVREAAADFLNAEGRSPVHVAIGIAATVGFALLATAIATRTVHPHPAISSKMRGGAAPITERPRGAFSLILPAVFSATTLSAVRVWNAPSNTTRTSAMVLWAGAQAINALWIALRPASRGMQIAAAMTSAGLAAAFAHEARKLDPGAGKLAAPTGGSVRVVNFFERKTAPRDATVH